MIIYNDKFGIGIAVNKMEIAMFKNMKAPAESIDMQNKTSSLKKRRKRSGASIVEVLVALVMLGVFIAGAGNVIVMIRKLSDQAQAHYVAINIAKNQIEQVRNLRRSDFDQILALQESGTRVDETGQSNPNGRFRRITRITKDSRNNFLIEVQVRVDLLDRVSLQFEGEHETLKSYIAHLLK